MQTVLNHIKIILNISPQFILWQFSKQKFIQVEICYANRDKLSTLLETIKRIQ